MKKIIFVLCSVLFFASNSLAAEVFEVWDSRTDSFATLTADPSITDLMGYAPYIAEDGSNPYLTEAQIIHGEDWYQVDGSKFPFSATVLLVGNNIKCSGALIGPYTVLTAAHCLMDSNRQPGSRPVLDPFNFTVYAGGKQYNQTARGTRIILSANSQNASKKNLDFYRVDYAILILDQPLGDEVGYLGFKKVNFKKNMRIALTGFPGIKDTNRPSFSPGKINSIERGFFYHSADVFAGNSGGPNFLENDLTNVVAVTVFELDDGRNNGSCYASDNLASFVSQYRFEQPSASEKQKASQSQRQSIIGNITKGIRGNKGSSNGTPGPDLGNIRPKTNPGNSQRPGLGNIRPKTNPGNSQRPGLGNLPKPKAQNPQNPKAGRPTNPNFRGLPIPQIGK